MGCTDQLEPSQRQAALDAAGQSIVEHLKREAVLERLVESRFGSLERLVAMQVMFYHMAARVAAFWYVQHASAVCGFQPGPAHLLDCVSALPFVQSAKRSGLYTCCQTFF